MLNSGMVKVCQIISGDLWAGAEAMAFHLLKGLKKYRDLELSVILLNEGKLADEIRGLDIPAVVVNESKLSFLGAFVAIKKTLDQRPPDVIHSHRYKENILAYLVSKTKKGIKLIGTQHGMPEVYVGGESLKHRFARKLNFVLLSKCFHDVVAVSRDIRKAFVNQYNFPQHKVKMIHNGIETPVNALTRKEKDTYVIGSSGRFFPVKDYPLMVEVAREVLKETNSVRFELAGDGPDKARIQELIRKYEMEKSFHLLGFVNQIATFYQGLDLYLNTSFHEGIPISVLEAMANQLPVIAAKVGGLDEIVEDGKNGCLIGNRDPKAYAKKCLKLIRNGALRGQMGFAAREKVIKEFSVDRMANQYYELYSSVTAVGEIAD